MTDDDAKCKCGGTLKRIRTEQVVKVAYAHFKCSKCERRACEKISTPTPFLGGPWWQ